VKATAATLTATKGASSRIGGVLDDLVSQVVSGFHGAIEQKIEGLANEVKRAIGAPTGSTQSGNYAGVRSQQSDASFNTSVGGDGLNAGIPRAD
jgi:hypothetical protein